MPRDQVPRDSVGFITGHRGESLREIERVSGTFCFADGEKGSNNKVCPCCRFLPPAVPFSCLLQLS